MDWYIGKTTCLAMLVVTMCGAMLMFVFTLLDAMAYSVEDGGFVAALWQAVRTLPRKIEELAPFAIFLGTLIGMGNLSSHSELTVFRSAGVSITRLFLSVCIPSVFMIVVAQSIVPLVFSTDERRLSAIREGVSSAWVREGTTFTRIGAVGVDDSLHGIAQYELGREAELVRIREAVSAEPHPNGGWQLKDVRDISIEAGRIERMQAANAAWETPRTADSLMTAFTTIPRKMSVVELYRQIEDLRATGQDSTEFQVEFWLKLTKPLSVLGLVLIAIGFVIGSTREMGMGARLTFGIAVGFAFHYLQTLVAPVTVVFALPPVLAIGTPILLVWVIGIVLIRRIG